ncbi:tRNA (N6-threonylcarbamoyladenosine(37)-N6)-methyltransferase TrmO [Haloferax sp. MBLA0076]|uniref:tRNA (N6-threonylcarbamoyladenosine(37)-N6)-methyltransferase TrmO n=1 Tax=Haloferax litoreum TaxID=2666140 RepID=A0A6A8GIM9_9EURY|nr:MULTISPECIES: SAM-dependent methyltransferase [Haloferax]KAB1193785.1 SAM-dependent methyltransferase [Haloferax sp. CBA1148]MRX22322.1 tRNA (N6-threonylcarbamoyladenosine(37)-N6)-methyltransferase TrmO [Haloferax litoreum]
MVNRPQTIELSPIGIVRSPRTEVADDHWGAVISTIELDSRWLPAASLRGLDSFSHAEVIFHVDRVDPNSVETAARHPRNRSDWPSVGIFAQRAKRRPNRLALSRCEIVAVDGHTVTVRGLDAIDGSPVLDIKPYMREFGPRGPVAQPDWSVELMERYYDSMGAPEDAY